MEQSVDTKKEKKDGLKIDNDHDFVFIKKWNPILRWVLVMPMAIVTLLIMKLTVGFFASKLMDSLDIYVLNLVIAAIATIITYTVVEISMVATAPMKNKTVAALICAIFPLGILIAITFGLNIAEVPVPAGEIYAQLGAGVVGIIVGILSAYTAMSDLKKKEVKEQEEISLETPAENIKK